MTANPGSDAAAAQGCTCARMDNAYGKGRTHNGERVFIISANCPLHGADAEREAL